MLFRIATAATAKIVGARCFATTVRRLAISPYALYLKQNWKAYPRLKPQARVLKLAAVWKKMSAEDKQKIAAKAQGLKSFKRFKMTRVHFPNKVHKYQKFVAKHIEGLKDSGMSTQDRLRAAAKAWNKA